ncbi:alpha-hydroxy-acid oxidizing protein [Sandaracinobacter sp. RS1-74]|uniref:alpha-hydroxy-acid oxidizing protein n=1 Tax=Sandaracinobacteroides sayramensis TaxID=2913411 RepID=UPI001ED9CA38|nr:alpha-hydroxy-acid oxidizing protein [Sandaracinobacteroides sayramensis]MCG2840969.1 alpha-hydroxy-acid oxidizing protein [Sandaracinobacteroides sayramensis]
MEIGLDGIIVSNHGGRVLDGLAHPLDVLPAIVESVDGRGPVLLDSGVRHGVDALTALALGARAVLVGRPQVHALAVAGMAGVAHMLHMLRIELEMAMAQTGCITLPAIDRRLLAPENQLQGPSI